METLATSLTSTQTIPVQQKESTMPKEPKWHYVYYALAFFDLLAISISLLINYQVSELYIESVEIDQQWATRLSDYTLLAELGTTVNMPGNDVFSSRDTELEREKFRSARIAFDVQMLNLHQDLDENVEIDIAKPLIADLFEIERDMILLSEEAMLVFEYFDKSPRNAGVQMAAMDQAYFHMNDHISDLRAHVRGIQKHHLDTQSAYAESLKKYEFAIAGFIILMILAVVVYGHFLATNSGKTAKEREDHLKKLEAQDEALQTANEQYILLNASLESRVEERTMELKRSNEELEQFAYIASHDLKEPLRKVVAFGDRLKSREQENLSDTGRDYLKRMQAASARMGVLIENLLQFSRIGTNVKPFTSVDLNETVHDVLQDLDTSIHSSNGSVEIEADLPTIEADEIQMKQLFQNMISNGIKYCRKDMPPVVTIQACIDGEYCVITFADNGIGIKEKYFERIFGVFQRLHGRDEYEGTGIGLSICKKTVDRHHGSITIESIPGKGTSFHVRLPIKQVKKEQHNA